LLAYDLQQNERGMPILYQAKTLLIHPFNRMLAKRLLLSAGLPGDNLNDLNPLADEGIQYIPDPWLTTQHAWYLLAAPEYVDVNFYWREMPDTKTWDDDDADATFHKIRQRHSVGFGDWRGTYGSPGA
jgi:hypothetical protein